MPNSSFISTCFAAILQPYDHHAPSTNLTESQAESPSPSALLMSMLVFPSLQAVKATTPKKEKLRHATDKEKIEKK